MDGELLKKKERKEGNVTKDVSRVLLASYKDKNQGREAVRTKGAVTNSRAGSPDHEKVRSVWDSNAAVGG